MKFIKILQRIFKQQIISKEEWSTLCKKGTSFFADTDTNNDGWITWPELKKALKDKFTKEKK